MTTFDDITSVESINSNVFNSVGDAMLSLRRNNINMITFETNSTITFNRSWNFESTGQSLGFPNFNILEPFSPSAPFLHITGETDTSTIRFIVGNAAYRVLEVNYNTVDFRRPLKVTTINNNAEFSTALILDATSNISFRSAGLEYFRLDNGRNDMVASRDITCVAKFQGNTYNTNGNSDMVFERSGVEFMKLKNTPSNLLDFTDVSTGAGISASWIYANAIGSRTVNQDTVFYGGNTAGDGRVEIFRYDRTGEQLDFNTIINNTGRTIVGTLQDTTVSDERLKTGIEDYEAECSNCIKNVKLHKFKYINEKYKDNDKYGFIAQELLTNLPEDMKGIVREVEDKESKDNVLTINYMKLSLILWKSLQEEMSKREHTESRLFEMETDIRDLKNKAKGKAKAKSKSNPKD